MESNNDNTQIADNFFDLVDEGATFLHEKLVHKGPYVLLAWNAEGDLAMHTNLSNGDAAIARAVYDASFHIAGEDAPQIVHIHLGRSDE